MMSAHLLRTEDAAAGGETTARSRRGFYGWLDRIHTWLLAGALRFRILVALLALAVVASSVPLYKLIKQDYIPSDVDEAEFEVIVTVPEGTSLAAMDEVMRALRRTCAPLLGCAWSWLRQVVASWQRQPR